MASQAEILKLLFVRDQVPTLELSRAISFAMGKQIVIINGEDVPHAFNDPDDIIPFTDNQLANRKSYIKASAEDALPGLKDISAKFWADFRSDNHTGCVQSPWGVEKEYAKPTPFSSRLNRTHETIACILITPNRKWSPEKWWQFKTGLTGSMIENIPDGDPKNDYGFFHEFGHVLQQIYTRLSRSFERWCEEKDADDFAFECLEFKAAHMPQDHPRTTALRETIVAAKKARLTKGFLNSTQEYLLVFDDMFAQLSQPSYFSPNVLKGLSIPEQPDNTAYLHCWLANTELRLRVLGMLCSEPLAQSSEDVFRTILKFNNGENIADPQMRKTINLANSEWKKYSSEESKLSALQAITKSGQITSPLTQLYANGVMEAVSYFCPSRFPAPVAAARPAAQPRATPPTSAPE